MKTSLLALISILVTSTVHADLLPDYASKEAERPKSGQVIGKKTIEGETILSTTTHWYEGCKTKGWHLVAYDKGSDYEMTVYCGPEDIGTKYTREIDEGI
jgi:hypothetical protein